MAPLIKSPRKLIEVALPLDVINVAAAREKSIRHGHPSTLHLWWARRPLAAARAVIFAQMVNDPGYQQGGGFKYGMEKKKAAEERQRLFKIIGTWCSGRTPPTKSCWNAPALKFAGHGGKCAN
jgi:putative DNA methylase